MVPYRSKANREVSAAKVAGEICTIRFRAGLKFGCRSKANREVNTAKVAGEICTIRIPTPLTLIMGGGVENCKLQLFGEKGRRKL